MAACWEDSEHQMQVLIGNEGWHTDSSYMPISAKASILSAHVLPSSGGETEWADMRTAYEALDDAMRARIDGLAAYHSLFHSQAKIGHRAKVGAGYGFYEGEPPFAALGEASSGDGAAGALHRPPRLRHSGAVGARIGAAADRSGQLRLPTAAHPAASLVGGGDVVIWDNRCVLHRARPYDHRQARVMQHTRIQGEPDTESGLAA